MANEVIEMDELMQNPIVRTHLLYFCNIFLKEDLTLINIHGSDEMFEKELASLDEEIERLTEYRRALKIQMKNWKTKEAAISSNIEEHLK